MKKIFVLALIVASAAAWAVFSVFSAGAEKAGYSFGIFMELDKDQQFKTIFTEALGYIAKTENIDINMKWYTGEKEFLQAAGKGGMDFAYSKKHDPFIALITLYGYEPFLTTSLFGKKTIKICIYANNKQKVTNIESLRGLRLITYATSDGYYPLRKLIGEKPQDFFSSVTTSTIGIESLSMISAGKADIALAYDTNADSLKVVNPVLAKSVNALVCGEPHYAPAMVRAKNVPEPIISKIQTFMEDADNMEALKKYRGVMKTTKIRFVIVSRKDYEPLIALYDEAQKKGWDKEYEKWIATAQKAK